MSTLTTLILSLAIASPSPCEKLATLATRVASLRAQGVTEAQLLSQIHHLPQEQSVELLTHVISGVYAMPEAPLETIWIRIYNTCAKS